MAFLGAGGGGSVGSIGATGGVLGVGSASSVGSVPGAGHLGCLGPRAPAGCVGPKPDMLSALVEQADAEVQKIVEEDARLAALPGARTDETATKLYPWTDEDDKLLQRVVSMTAADAPAGVAIWDARMNAFNAGRANVRTKNALRQRWNVLRSHGWRAAPAEKTGGVNTQSVQWWSPEDDACLSGEPKTKPLVASRSSASAATGNHVGSNNFKQAGNAHHKLRRDMAAINKDIAALRTVPVGHNTPEQEQLVSKVAQLIQAVENVDRLWLAVQSDRLDAQVTLVWKTCLELTATAKEVRAWIGAAFKPESRAVIPDTTPDEMPDAKHPKKKRKQIRNANQHAQAGIARKVLLAWLAHEDPRPAQNEKYTFMARSQEAKDEMLRLVNAALIEHGLLPAYRHSNLVNWFKNMSYKQTLVAQGRLPPSWARANSNTEERYLSRSSTDPLTRRKSEWASDDAYRYDPKRLRTLAESQDQTIAYAIGQDEFTADNFDTSSDARGAKKTQSQQCAEHAKRVLNNYINAEQPQLMDPYCATARSDATCDHLVALVNATLVDNRLKPVYLRKNLTNWFKNMSYKMSLETPSLHVHSTGGDPAAVEAAGCAAEGSDESFELDEEEEMQRGVDNFLFPSLRGVGIREHVTTVDAATRQALLSKYSASIPSLPAKRKAHLLLKSIELIEAS